MLPCGENTVDGGRSFHLTMDGRDVLMKIEIKTQNLQCYRQEIFVNTGSFNSSDDFESNVINLRLIKVSLEGKL